MIGIEPYKRHRQVIAQTAVHQIAVCLCRLQIQLLSPFQYLKDQLLVFAALFTAQILYMLYAGSLYRSESKRRISLFDHTDHIVPQLHFRRQDILHAGNRLFAKCHVKFSFSLAPNPFPILHSFRLFFKHELDIYNGRHSRRNLRCAGCMDFYNISL